MAESRFYDIDSYWESTAKREGWNSKDEFERVVRELEQKSRDELLRLLGDFEIEYPVTSTTGKEELLSILISDIAPAEFRKAGF